MTRWPCNWPYLPLYLHDR